MITSIVSLVLLAAAPAPEVKCEIAMKSWCIVGLPAAVSLADNGDTRLWTITLSQDVAEAEVMITEDKFCDGKLEPVLHSGPHRGTFSISTDQGCGLRISVSKQAPGVEPDVIAKQVIMLRGGNQWTSLQF